MFARKRKKNRLQLHRRVIQRRSTTKYSQVTTRYQRLLKK